LRPSDLKFKLAEKRKMLEKQEKTTTYLKSRLDEMREFYSLAAGGHDQAFKSKKETMS